MSIIHQLIAIGLLFSLNTRSSELCVTDVCNYTFSCSVKNKSISADSSLNRTKTPFLFMDQSSSKRQFVAFFDGDAQMVQWCKSHIETHFAMNKKKIKACPDRYKKVLEQTIIDLQQLSTREQFNNAQVAVLLYCLDKKSCPPCLTCSWVGNIRTIIANEQDTILGATVDHLYHYNKIEGTRIYNTGCFTEYNDKILKINDYGSQITRRLGSSFSELGYILSFPESIIVSLKEAGMYKIIVGTHRLWSEAEGNKGVLQLFSLYSPSGQEIIIKCRDNNNGSDVMRQNQLWNNRFLERFGWKRETHAKQPDNVMALLTQIYVRTAVVRKRSFQSNTYLCCAMGIGLFLIYLFMLEEQIWAAKPAACL
jgi:hypothetical protein